jgi:hypothetical protein
VYVVVHVAVPAEPESVHGLGLKEPFEGEDEKLTEPVGVLTVPPSVSVTVAVHVVPSATSCDEGTQEIAVLVVRVLTVSLAVPLLTAWVASPP